MPTNFTQNDFNGGDLIKAGHIKRTFQPINNLETGAAWFRVDTGAANAHVVDFSDPDENGLDAGALTDGQIVHFKASAANTGAVTLTLNGVSSSTVTLPIKKSGNTDLAAGDIQAGQIVAVMYNSSSGGRFEVSSSAGTLTAANMPSGIDATKIGSGSISNTEFGYLNGVTSSIQSQLNGKVSGSGVTGRLAYWSGSNSLTSSSYFYASGDTLYSASFRSTSGYYDSNGELYLRRAGTNKARFGVSQTWLYNVRNASGAQLLYWFPTGTYQGEVVFLYSRGKHKKNITPIKTSIDDIMNWRAVEFDWKEKFGGQRDLGLISEEVAELYPLAATYDEEWEYLDEETGDYQIDEEGRPRRKEGPQVPAGVKYERAWLPMLAALQDFYRRYQSLESEVRDLKSQIARSK